MSENAKKDFDSNQDKTDVVYLEETIEPDVGENINDTVSDTITAVSRDGLNLRFVKNQTEDICLSAVQENGCALVYVDEQTKTICLTAVKQDGDALQYVRKQTEKICLAAVQQSGSALQYVKDQTPEICFEAILQDGCALRYVKNQTREICLAAVTKCGDVLQYVKHQTPEICFAAVCQDGMALQYVKKQTPKICLAAVQQNGDALKYVRNKTDEICETALTQNECAAAYIPEDKRDICIKQKIIVKNISFEKWDPIRFLNKLDCPISEYDNDEIAEPYVEESPSSTVNNDAPWDPVQFIESYSTTDKSETKSNESCCGETCCCKKSECDSCTTEIIIDKKNDTKPKEIDVFVAEKTEIQSEKIIALMQEYDTLATNVETLKVKYDFEKERFEDLKKELALYWDAFTKNKSDFELVENAYKAGQKSAMLHIANDNTIHNSTEKPILTVDDDLLTLQDSQEKKDNTKKKKRSMNINIFSIIAVLILYLLFFWGITHTNSVKIDNKVVKNTLSDSNEIMSDVCDILPWKEPKELNLPPIQFDLFRNEENSFFDKVKDGK